jgi:hypothetical protein
VWPGADPTRKGVKNVELKPAAALLHTVEKLGNTEMALALLHAALAGPRGYYSVIPISEANGLQAGPLITLMRYKV